MSNYKLFVCSNTETVADGYDLPGHLRDDIVVNAVDAACRVIDAYDFRDTVVSQCDSTFSHWHGGRHAKTTLYGKQLAFRCGFVAVHFEQQTEGPEWLRTLVEDANDALVSVLEDHDKGDDE